MFSCCPLGPSPLEAREYDENATATGAQKVLDQCYALAWLQLQLLQTRTDPKKAFRALGRPSVPTLTPGAMAWPKSHSAELSHRVRIVHHRLKCDPARGLDAAPPALAPPAASCPVCYEDYEDPFPRPTMCTPTPRERWSCASLRQAHAVCRDCDALVQSSTNTAYPLCRALRLLFVQGDS